MLNNTGVVTKKYVKKIHTLNPNASKIKNGIKIGAWLKAQGAGLMEK
ncbi:MAG: hypothetical protein JXL81_04210 [Deltaproteobacteria bacterium]|nr:hypothetical protein [Deltaproteobacteria bacterium]